LILHKNGLKNVSTLGEHYKLLETFTHGLHPHSHLRLTCQTPQLSPNLEKLQVWFPYLAWAFVGRKISDVCSRGTPGYRREWQESISRKVLIFIGY
jgi:hypothetical protein